MPEVDADSDVEAGTEAMVGIVEMVVSVSEEVVVKAVDEVLLGASSKMFGGLVDDTVVVVAVPVLNDDAAVAVGVVVGVETILEFDVVGVL